MASWNNNIKQRTTPMRHKKKHPLCHRDITKKYAILASQKISITWPQFAFIYGFMAFSI